MGILLAPHVKIKSYQEHLPARIISATMKVKGMIIAVLDVYTPTDSTKSVTAKSVFYSALSKAKPEVDQYLHTVKRQTRGTLFLDITRIELKLMIMGNAY